MDATMEICPFDLESHPTACGLREAFAEVARRRCGGDVGTLGRTMREWGLSADQARGLIEGKTSIRTMEMVLQHKNGGWRVGLTIMQIVIGKRLTDYFSSERSRLNHEAELRRQRAAALEEAERFFDAPDVGARSDRNGSHLPDLESGLGLRMVC